MVPEIVRRGPIAMAVDVGDEEHLDQTVSDAAKIDAQRERRSKQVPGSPQ
jgi:hypothetical protein